MAKLFLVSAEKSHFIALDEGQEVTIVRKRISQDEALTLLRSTERFISKINHKHIAAGLALLLGERVRYDMKPLHSFNPGDKMLIVSYRGPNINEGDYIDNTGEYPVFELPDGGKFTFYTQEYEPGGWDDSEDETSEEVSE